MQTIVAQSSGQVKSAVAVVRMSGGDSFYILKQIFSVKKMQPRKLYVGTLTCKNLLDHAMAVKFCAPHSYSGEDMVEFYVHGSKALCRALIEQCIELGAREAEAGEFTKRAFLNGKLDLTRAEGVIDLIDAESEAEARAAYEQSQGAVFRRIKEIQQKLTPLIAAIEVCIDYPEEVLEGESEDILSALVSVVSSVRALKDSFLGGRVVREGVSVALAGAPNAGKSSLLNALLGFDRAIVTDIAGTTRDVLVESYIHKDMRFNVYDTAGLNPSAVGIERMGIARALEVFSLADIILWLDEGDAPLPKELAPHHQKLISIASKADKYQAASNQNDELKSLNYNNDEQNRSYNNLDYSVSFANNQNNLDCSVSFANNQNDLDCSVSFANNQNADKVNSVNSINIVSPDKKNSGAKIGQNVREMRAQKDVEISAFCPQDIEKLKQLIYDRSPHVLASSSVMITSRRHHSALAKALERLLEAQKNIEGNLPYVIIAQDLTDAWRHLGAITGTVSSDEIIHEIFSRFCIGK